MADKLQIINSALRIAGSGAISSLSDTSPTALIALNAWKTTVESVFGDEYFSEQTFIASLSSPSDSIHPWFKRVFTLPQDYQNLVRVLDADGYPIREYTVTEGTKVSCNREKIVVFYTVIPDDSGVEALTGKLQELVRLHLAGSITTELTGDDNRAEFIWNQFRRARSRARVLDARAAPGEEWSRRGEEECSGVLRAHRGGYV